MKHLTFVLIGVGMLAVVFLIGESIKTGMKKLVDWRWRQQFKTPGCTGDTTCPVDECMECSVRDCPHMEPLHYHHDGCPACYVVEQHKCTICGRSFAYGTTNVKGRLPNFQHKNCVKAQKEE